MIFISSKASDGNMMTLENRRKFLKKMRIKNAVEVKQIHGNNIVLVPQTLDPNTQSDGLITNNPALYLMIKVADCMALGLFDPKQKAIGLAHVGWRGSESGIVKNIVNQMKINFHTNPKDLIVTVSPSIGPCHYKMDLWKEAENQLIDCGILKENIDNPKICTYESKNYFSHRRSEDVNEPEGRFVTILGI